MHENIVRIKAVARGLDPLDKEVYFIGGAVTSLYADKQEVFEHRFTDDVDVVLEITSRGKYYSIQERLREIGFSEDAESNVICRWKYQGITVDIMPINADVLGFTNRWYEDGIQNSMQMDISDGFIINIFSYPYFLASKFEALNNRNTDWRYSKDFEDIIKTIDSRKMDSKSFQNCKSDIKDFIRDQINNLLNDERFLHEAIFSILFPNNSSERIDDILIKLKSLV